MDDLASLGFSIDSTPLAESERAMDRMTAAATKVDAATKGMTASQQALGAATSATTAQTEKQADSVRRASQYDEALTAAYRRATMQIGADAQARVAAMKTVEAQAASSASAVAKQYQSMRDSAQQYAQDLSRTVDKIKVGEAYTASLKSAQQYTMGLAASTRAMAADIAAAGAQIVNTSQAAGTAVSKLTAQQRLMLGYQLNDIFTQASMGTNPLIIGAQQGPQITQIFGGLKNTLGAIPAPALAAGGAALAVGGAVYAADSMARMNDELAEQQRRFTTLFGSKDQAVAVYQDIGKFAASAGIDIAGATDRVIAFAKATDMLGASRQNIVDLASTVEKLTQLSGATPSEGGSAQQAVAGMLQSAYVSADQLKSVLQNVPQIADKIAAGLGVSVTQLRLLVSEGDLTNKQVFGALLSQTGKVRAEFEQMPKSVSSTFASIGDDLAMLTKRLTEDGLVAKAYRATLEGIASAAKALREASTPETAAQIAARTGGASFAQGPVGLGGTNMSPGAAAGSRVGQVDYYAAQYDLATQAVQQWAQAVRDAVKEADNSLVAASATAAKFDPLTQAFRQSDRDIEQMEKSLADLQSGLTSLSAEEAAAQMGRLENAITKAKRAAQDLDPSLKVLNDINQRNQFRATDDTPAGMALQGRIAELSKTSPYETASTAALAEQQEKIADIVKSKQQDAAASDAITKAMGQGKKALIEAQVEAATLAFIMANVGKNTEGFAEEIGKFRDAMRTIFTNDSIQAGINASKPLITELDGIAAAMKVVEQGAYAMKRAQAEAKAAADENGTGDLQMKVFDAQQALTDATAIDSLNKQIKLTNDLAAAAGDVARQKQIQLDYDIKQAQLAAGPGAQAAIAEKMRADATAKRVLELRNGAADMQRDVDLAQQQLGIIRSGSPDQAAQIAMLQKRNQLLAQGVDIQSEEAQKQIGLAGQKARTDEQLGFEKDAADATKRTWMNAYDGIQSAGADAFYSIFTGAGLNGQTAADTIKNIFLKAFAEIAAAAIIRPVITPIFQAAAGAGLIPNGVVPAATGSMPFGFGGGTSSSPYGFADQSGAYGGLGGGGSPLGMLNSIGGRSSGGGLGSIFGSGWLNKPIFGGGIDSEIANWSTYGTPAMGSQGLFSANATFGDALGGIGSLAGIGMGAYQMANAQGAGSMISGASSIIGGGLGLAAMAGLGAALGPIGLAIGIGGGLLGGMIGDGGPKIPPMPGLNYQQGTLTMNSGGIVATGGLGGAAGAIGNSVQSLIGATGGTGNAGMLWGGTIASGTNHTWDGKQWQGQDYTQGNLLSPTGDVLGFGGAGQGISVQDASDKMTFQIFRQDVMSGAIKGLSSTLQTALSSIFSNLTEGTSQAAAQAVASAKTFADAYDSLGKSSNQVIDSLKALDKQFGALAEQAGAYGLSGVPIAQELNKEQTRLAQDFIDNMINPMAAQLRALADQKDQAMAAIDYIKANFSGITVDMTKVSDYFADQEKQIRDSFNQAVMASVDTLQQAIDRLKPGGDLANLDPSGTLAGLKATYDATAAQAMANDPTAIANLATAGTNYAQFYKSYSGGNADYTTVRDQIMAVFQQVQSAIQIPASNNNAPLDANNPGISNLVSMQQRSQQQIDQLTQMLADEREENTKLKALMNRVLSNRAVAA